MTRFLRNLRALAPYAQPYRLPPFDRRRARRLLALHAVSVRRRQRATVPAQRSTPPLEWVRPSEAARRSNRGGRG